MTAEEERIVARKLDLEWILERDGLDADMVKEACRWFWEYARYVEAYAADDWKIDFHSADAKKYAGKTFDQAWEEWKDEE